MKRKYLFVAAFLTIVCSALMGYTIFWIFLAQNVERQIIYNVSKAKQEGITIEGKIPTVTGFPFPHHLVFRGTISGDDWAATIPEMHITGFLLPGRSLEIEFPQGFKIVQNDPLYDELLAFNYALIQGEVPNRVPEDFTVEQLRDWRNLNGNLTIDNFDVQTEMLRLSGNSMITVDGDLQPAGTLSIMVKGHMALLGYLQQKEQIDRKEALITATVLSGFTQQDPETGERFLKADLTLQNRSLLLGPLQIIELPRIRWPYRYN